MERLGFILEQFLNFLDNNQIKLTFTGRYKITGQLNSLHQLNTISFPGQWNTLHQLNTSSFQGWHQLNINSFTGWYQLTQTVTQVGTSWRQTVEHAPPVEQFHSFPVEHVDGWLMFEHKIYLLYSDWWIKWWLVIDPVFVRTIIYSFWETLLIIDLNQDEQLTTFLSFIFADFSSLALLGFDHSYANEFFCCVIHSQFF